jgi:hypothetical protein
MPFFPSHFMLIVIILLFCIVPVILPFGKIFAKAGFPSVLGVLMIVPLVNFILLFFLAFSEWPALRKSQ